MRNLTLRPETQSNAVVITRALYACGIDVRSVRRKRRGLGSVFGELVAELLDRTPGVVDAVVSRLPKGFPDSVAGPVLDGLQAAAGRFAL